MDNFLAIVCIAAIPVLVATYLLQLGLSKAGRQRVGYLIGSGLILIGIAIFIWSNSRSLGLGPVFAALAAGSSILGTFPGAAWLVWKLRGYQKLYALIVFPAFPLILVASFKLGETTSLASETERNGEKIVEALSQYHAAHETYPERIESLIPDYLDELPIALSNSSANWYGGWLYVSNGTTFMLGYTEWPDRDGATICSISSDDEKWSCELTFWTEWDTFPRIPPTTVPCIRDDEWIDIPECDMQLTYVP